MDTSSAIPPSLAARAATAGARLSACDLCPRRCGADRTRGISRTTCRVGRTALVHAAGEGRIVFAGCNMRCLHCPLPAAAWETQGTPAGAEALAAIMLDQQAAGWPRLTLVNPGHVAAQVLEALALATAAGFRLPVEWRSGGYDAVETLALFDGVVDAYRIEIKFGDDAAARSIAGVRGYVDASRAALAEMARQPARVTVRHRVLPDGLAGSAAVLALAAQFPGVEVEILDGYRPCWRASRHPRLNRAVTEEDVETVRRISPR